MKAHITAEIAAYPTGPQIVYLLYRSRKLAATGDREPIAFFMSRSAASEAAMVLALTNRQYWFSVKPEREVVA